MLGIILTGHGGFASGLEQAMKQILGEQPQFIAIDFPESSTTARLTAQLEQAVSELDGQHDIVFLTDLLGGGDAVPGGINTRHEKTRQRSDYRYKPAAVT